MPLCAGYSRIKIPLNPPLRKGDKGRGTTIGRGHDDTGVVWVGKDIKEGERRGVVTRRGVIKWR